MKIFSNLSKEKKKYYQYVFLSTFIIGLLIHFYKMSNTLLNHDSIYNYYSDQNVIASGRWFLSIACSFSTWYDLPWVTGLFTIFFIALTNLVVVDVLKISEAMNTTDDQLILGERKFDKDVPLRSRFGNSCTRVIFRLLYGMKVEDTQTGLRGIPNKLILQFDDLEGERYEYEMNMLIICSIKKIKIKSINIQTIYLDDNSSSHFNAVKDSFRIYRLLFKNFFKFVVSSLSSSLIDIILFQMLVIFLKEKSSRYILLSTIGARVFSSIYNFTLNKKIVFNSNNKLGHTIIKYYLLCLIQMLISAGFVTGIYIIVPINETIIKIVVDTILFFISYRIQKSWIFSKK